MPMVRTKRTDPLPPRWRQVLEVLAEESLTMAQLAERLGVSQKTARSYLSEAAKHATIRAKGPWGKSVYGLEAPTEEQKKRTNPQQERRDDSDDHSAHRRHGPHR